MPKNHLKSLAAPKTWDIKRKGIVFTTRPFPSGHPMKFSLPLSLALKMLEKSRNEKETNIILQNKDILIDGIARKNRKQTVGILDVLSIPKMKETYRLILTTKGKLAFINAEESDKKIVKIIGKRMWKGKVQYSLNDGTITITDSPDYAVGDGLVVSLPDRKILQYLKLEKGVIVYLIGGANLGKQAKVVNVEGKKIFCKSGDKEYETLRKYAFVVGKDKSEVKLE